MSLWGGIICGDILFLLWDLWWRECVLMFWSGCGNGEVFRAPCQPGFSHNIHSVYLLYMISSWGSLLLAFQQLPVTPQVSPCFSLCGSQGPREFSLLSLQLYYSWLFSPVYISSYTGLFYFLTTKLFLPVWCAWSSFAYNSLFPALHIVLNITILKGLPSSPPITYAFNRSSPPQPPAGG